MAFAVTSDNTQKVTGITAAPTSANGAAAPVDGPLRITITSGDGTVVQDPATPLSFDVISGTAVGDTVYHIEADADMGAGVTLIADDVTYTVTAPPIPQATALGFSAGTVVPK